MADVVSPVALVFSIFMVTWMVTLSYVLFNLKRHYNLLIKTGGRKGLQESFDTLYESVRQIRQTSGDLQNRLNKEEKDSELSIQKMSLVRFNPFPNMGGEQSFSIALLNMHDSGVLITALSGRGGTRWYVKRIKDQKGVEIELSKEEEQAIKTAKSLT